jgi:micrococcal nuclease
MSVLCAVALSACGDAGARHRESTTALASSEKASVSGEPASAAPPRAPKSPASTIPAGAAATIASVTDGDTVRLTGGARVRLVQIDTPEVFGGAECGGAEASAALKRELPSGTVVRLVRDPLTDSSDRYGRLLRYVYRGPRNLNVWMVAKGYAAPYFYRGEEGRYSVQLLRVARNAQASRRGLWGGCPQAVLDARRGVATGRPPGSGGAADAVAGAAQVARLPAAPPYPPDVDCSDLPGPVRVTPDDPHHLDGDGDGIGCD